MQRAGARARLEQLEVDWSDVLEEVDAVAKYNRADVQAQFARVESTPRGSGSAQSSSIHGAMWPTRPQTGIDPVDANMRRIHER
jgi:hypothetical protein